MIRAARQMEIMARLRRNGVVSASELAEAFDASMVTIRRDLVALEHGGLLVRTHGGATTPQAGSYEPSPYPIRELEHATEKALIARKAAEYVRDGDAIIMNAGTTMHELAKALRRHRDLRVVTNGLTVAAELVQTDATQVTLIGGLVDAKKLGTVGPLAEESVRDIYVERAFLGVTGLSVEHGLSMHSPVEAQINKHFIRAAREVTVVVDSSKFKSCSPYRIVPLREVHRIITDGNIDAETKQAIEDLGVELIIVDGHQIREEVVSSKDGASRDDHDAPAVALASHGSPGSWPMRSRPRQRQSAGEAAITKSR